MIKRKHIALNYWLITFTLFCSIFLKAQWAYDPSTNTKLVVNPSDPINIFSVSDKKGGAFIVWQDTKPPQRNDVLFLHVNKDGETSFRSDGKSVSLSLENKFEPQSVLLPEGDLLILWKEKISGNTSEIFIQKITNKGLRLWSDFGIQLTRLNKEIKEYSVDVDKDGNTTILFITKESNNPTTSVYVVKLNSFGKIISEPKKLFNSSESKISDCKILSVSDKQYFILWLETEESRATLYFSKINLNSDSVSVQKKSISKLSENVLSFGSSLIGTDLYVNWYSHEKQKSIYHQLISSDGNFKWGSEGKLVTTKRGQNSNPQFAVSNKNIFVSWVNEYGNDKNIYAQLFDFKGNKIWKENGTTVIEYEGDQFGQKVIYDNREKYIIAWIDRRFTKQFGNIYAQKVNSTGELQWTNTGVDLGTYTDSEKSYLNLLPDEQGGAIAIFKDKREKKSEIYGQKIYSTGTYAGQILGLKCEPEVDTVKVFWYAANENDDVVYEVQRKLNAEENWQTVEEIKKGNSATINYYEYKDSPNSEGLISYRVIQKSKGNQQISETVTLELINETSDYTLLQNVPNPFSETTSISFILPKEEYVEIEIYDVKLNQLGTITQKIFPAGKNTVSFDAKRLGPGVYFYKMKAGDFVSVKKMVVSK
ncbi:5'-Nucleotidase domain protein [Ignavibacterium album JCM 16511]|uniref:5'-Nucleotidase domain protein n=1 Tax=Ignavibacterium album (strain DSM 19864 / JCM 16511 / NBRC 101810 / Mat9-16) TaxID=945713 RepID=I0AGF2_IGNAJ|nr:T9SS type A sorting domain-containing protein [Ignavibacterium album]AFH48059.1 5'-Nucleotidase domain protein [Ignavibacterium album JCM 16511]